MAPVIIALIPARAGSKRVPGKNMRYLGGKPLLLWAILAAQQSEIFGDVLVCTDSSTYAKLAKGYGASVFDRAESNDYEPDIAWVSKVAVEIRCDAFAILRPTNPFRTAETIKRAWQHFLDNQPCDSLRAVELVKQHPGKMWVARSGHILPLLPWEADIDGTPWHSSPTQSLPHVYVQNASIEIAWRRTIIEQHTISGTSVLPFYTEGLEGFDINTEADFEEATRLWRLSI